MTDDREIDVRAVINKSRFGGYQLWVATVCGIIAMLDGFDTQGIAYVAPVIAREWRMNIAAFGPIFGAGLFGLLLGAVIFGTLADRFGRKQTILWSMLIFSVLSFAPCYATSFQSLLVLRFLTGLGLGGATPTIIALTCEYTPDRLRSTVVNIMFCGFPFGSTLGGFLSAWMIPAYGWQAVFYVGSVLPLIFAVIVLIWLPESLSFMVERGTSAAKIGQIMGRIDPSGRYAASMRYVLHEAKLTGFTAKHLFTEGRTFLTCALWVAFFMNLLVMLFLVNWLPALLRESGKALQLAIISTPILNLGGVLGAALLGFLSDRLGPYRVLGTAYVMSACFIAIAAYSGGNTVILLSAVFFAGIGVVGGQNGINSLAASSYPTTIRSTAVGWAFGVGRIGAIAGPVIGGLLVGMGWKTQSIILVSALPTLVAAIAVYSLGTNRTSRVELSSAR